MLTKFPLPSCTTQRANFYSTEGHSFFLFKLLKGQNRSPLPQQQPRSITLGHESIHTQSLIIVLTYPAWFYRAEKGCTNLKIEPLYSTYMQEFPFIQQTKQLIRNNFSITNSSYSILFLYNLPNDHQSASSVVNNN